MNFMLKRLVFVRLHSVYCQNCLYKHENISFYQLIFRPIKQAILMNYIHKLQISLLILKCQIFFTSFYFVSPLLYLLILQWIIWWYITFILLHFCYLCHCVICNFIGFINVYLDITIFVKIISSILTQKYCNWTGKPIVQHTVSDFVPGFQWQLYACLACVTAIAGPQHINCRKAISLVRLRSVINVLRTLVCTALNHRTNDYSRTPNKILSPSECYEVWLSTGPLFHMLL